MRCLGSAAIPLATAMIRIIDISSHDRQQLLVPKKKQSS
ncbi:MAG: hypothetical protein OJF50_004602 [Nitrospira sp.]|nr:hypothetical protein [Nitrospira sp.]